MEPRIDNAPILVETRMAKDDTVNYRAKSVLTSKTEVVNAIMALVALLGSSQISAMLGPGAFVYVTIAVAVLNMILRLLTVRPVAMIMPGETKPVAVPKLAA